MAVSGLFHNPTYLIRMFFFFKYLINFKTFAFFVQIISFRHPFPRVETIWARGVMLSVFPHIFSGFIFVNDMFVPRNMRVALAVAEKMLPNFSIVMPIWCLSNCHIYVDTYWRSFLFPSLIILPLLTLHIMLSLSQYRYLTSSSACQITSCIVSIYYTMHLIWPVTTFIQLPRIFSSILIPTFTIIIFIFHALVRKIKASFICVTFIFVPCT